MIRSKSAKIASKSSPCSGASRRERVANLARAHAREDRKALRVVEVIGDPVGEAVGLGAEVFHREIWKSGNPEIYPITRLPDYPIYSRLSTVIVAGDGELGGHEAAGRNVDRRTVARHDRGRAAGRADGAADRGTLAAAQDAAEDRSGDRRAADLLGAIAGGRFARRGRSASVRSAHFAAVGEDERVEPDPDVGRASSPCRPLSTSMTLPITRAPAGIATRPAAMTSRDTRASTRSSTRARSDESDVSSCRPITEDDGRMTSSNCGTRGGSGCGSAGFGWLGERAQRDGCSRTAPSRPAVPARRRDRRAVHRHRARHGRFGPCGDAAPAARRRAGFWRRRLPARRGGRGLASAFAGFRRGGRLGLGAAHGGFGFRDRLGGRLACGRVRAPPAARRRAAPRPTCDLGRVVPGCDVRATRGGRHAPESQQNKRQRSGKHWNCSLCPLTEQGAYPSNRP